MKFKNALLFIVIGWIVGLLTFEKIGGKPDQSVTSTSDTVIVYQHDTLPAPPPDTILIKDTVPVPSLVEAPISQEKDSLRTYVDRVAIDSLTNIDYTAQVSGYLEGISFHVMRQYEPQVVTTKLQVVETKRTIINNPLGIYVGMGVMAGGDSQPEAVLTLSFIKHQSLSLFTGFSSGGRVMLGVNVKLFNR
jgi:hypothetical protein